MSSCARNQLLDQALQVSQQMTECGGAGDWEQVIALEKQRSELLQQALSDDTGPADEPTAKRIRAILDFDKQLMSLGVEARDEAARELSQMQRGRKGQQAYQSIGR